jgi:hypothetical protein
MWISVADAGNTIETAFNPLLESGALKPVVASVRPMADAAAAFDELAAGHVRGGVPLPRAAAARHEARGHAQRGHARQAALARAQAGPVQGHAHAERAHHPHAGDHDAAQLAQGGRR